MTKPKYRTQLVYAFDSKRQLAEAYGEQSAAALCRQRWQAAQFLATAPAPPESRKTGWLQ